jgi:hypothetical protein
MTDFEGTFRLPSIDPMLWNVTGNVRLNLAAIYLGAKLSTQEMLRLTVSRISYEDVTIFNLRNILFLVCHRTKTGIFPFKLSPSR